MLYSVPNIQEQRPALSIIFNRVIFGMYRKVRKIENDFKSQSLCNVIMHCYLEKKQISILRQLVTRSSIPL